MQRVVEELTRIFLADIKDPLTRGRIDAASVVRRTTEPLLRAMLPDVAPQDAFERLRALPFVEISRDGLVLHEAVREAGAAALRAADPGRYRQYRRAAWGELRAEVVDRSDARAVALHRRHAVPDREPTVREAFFPSGAQVYAVEPALPRDEDAIRAITSSGARRRSTACSADWWDEAPEGFSLIRDRDGHVVGFYAMFDPAEVSRGRLWTDPVTRVLGRAPPRPSGSQGRACAVPAPVAGRRGRRGALADPGRRLAGHQAHLHGDAAAVCAASTRRSATWHVRPDHRPPAVPPTRGRGRRLRRRDLPLRRPGLRAVLGRRLAGGSARRGARPRGRRSSSTSTPASSSCTASGSL